MLQVHKGRLSWTGSGRGLSNPQSVYTIHFFDRSTGFQVAENLNATHEVYLVKSFFDHIPPTVVLFRGQFDFRIPCLNPKQVAKQVAEAMIVLLQEMVDLDMVIPHPARQDLISKYWATFIEETSAQILNIELSKLDIPRLLYEFDREFYLASFPY